MIVPLFRTLGVLPVPDAPKTAADVIAAKKAADAQALQARQAAAKADADAAAAQQAADEAAAVVKDELASAGPLLVANADSTYEVWQPDQSAAGYHSFPIPLASAVPIPPAPKPA